MAEQCPTCGNPASEGANFCPVCGTPATPSAAAAELPAEPQAQVEAPAEVPAEAPSEAPAEAPSEAPAEAPSEAPSSPSTPPPGGPPIVVPPPPTPPPPPPAPLPAAYPPPAASYPPPSGGYVPPGGGSQEAAGSWAPPPPKPMKPIEQIMAEGYQIDLGAVIGEGWNMFVANAGGFVGFALVGGLIAVFLAVTIIGLLFVTPLMAGFFIVPLLMLKGRKTTFGNFFDGFSKLGGYVLLGLVMGLFVILGYIFLIIPGIYLTVAYTWALALMADRDLSFWDAMKTSMRVVNHNFWETLLLVLVVGLITSAGGIVFFGSLVTLPLGYCILIATYRHIFGLNQQA